MTGNRVEHALTRLEIALQRIAAARSNDAPPNEASAKEPGNSARIMALVNSHEKLREEIADALGDLDALIEDLEGTERP